LYIVAGDAVVALSFKKAAIATDSIGGHTEVLLLKKVGWKGSRYDSSAANPSPVKAIRVTFAGKRNARPIEIGKFFEIAWKEVIGEMTCQLCGVATWRSVFGRLRGLGILRSDGVAIGSGVQFTPTMIHLIGNRNDLEARNRTAKNGIEQIRH